MKKKTGRVAYKKTIRQAFALLIVFLVASSPVRGRISSNLTADLRVSYSTTDEDSSSLESVDQEYNVAWQKNIMRDLAVRSALRYYNFGVSENLGANSWRSELQPSADLIFNRAWLGINAQAMRRDSRSNDRSSRLINESGSIALQSRVARYPWMRLRLQQDLLYNKANLSDRDTRDRMALASAGYTARMTSISYSFTYKNTLDRSQRVEQNTSTHGVLFGQVKNFGSRLRSSLSYDFSYKKQSDRNLAFDPLPLELPVFFGLYASDATPDLGGLDSVSTLIDGNLSLPAVPPINIGSNSVNQNLGIDLGYRREISRLYVYTDRPSGNNVRWAVFQSEDNTVWESVAGASSSFSPGFSRYEIRFPEISARYIKAVNAGLNEVDTVLVTEVAGYLDKSETGVIERDQQIHLASLNNSLKLSESLSATAGVSLRRDGGSSFNQKRDETYYSFGLRNQPSKVLQHSARIQVGLIDYDATRFDVDKTLTANYDLQYQPLTTLAFSLSLSHRDNYIAGVKSQEINHAVIRSRGDLLPRLTITQEFGGGRNTIMISRVQLDSWNYRAGLLGRPVRSMDFSAAFLHQEVRSLPDAKRIKNQYLGDVGWALTPAFQLRASVDYTEDDRTRYLSQDYSITWSVSSKLTSGAALNISDYQNGADNHSKRLSAQVEYLLSQRTALSAGFGETDFTRSGGRLTRSFRVGLRTGL